MRIQNDLISIWKFLLKLMMLLLVLSLCGCSNTQEENVINSELDYLASEKNVTSYDAKFFNSNIIAGVDGYLSLMSIERDILKTYDISANWCYPLEEEGIVIYGNFDHKLGIAKIDDENNLIDNQIIFDEGKLCIDPTIVRVNKWYYITFTEVEGAVNNSNPNSDNGEYILHMYRSENLNDWQEISTIRDINHNIEDIDIIYEDEHFLVFYEEEDYDKGCSSINVIKSKDSEGFEWEEPIQLLPNDADHEMASIWNNEDKNILWYSCDKDDLGMSYMSGKIYYAIYDKSWNFISKDNLIDGDYDRMIGGVRLYEVKKINDKVTFLYAKDYLTDNILSVLQER